MLSLQYVCIYVHLCVCVCAKWASRPFCCLWWMFLIERQRSSVPRVLFLSLAHGSNSAAFLRYQTHVTLPTVSLSAPRRVCTLSPPRLFIPRANRKLLQRVPDWSGGPWIRGKYERGRYDLLRVSVVESSTLTRLNLREGLTYPSAHACMILHAVPRWELMHICRHKIANLTVGE